MPFCIYSPWPRKPDVDLRLEDFGDIGANTPLLAGHEALGNVHRR